jgi:hypothetical protein
MDNICVDCRNSKDCKRKPRTDQWKVAGCSWFEAYTIVTNADHIRSKSDEELAIFMRMRGCPTEEINNTCKNNRIKEKSCTRCWLDWLKSPVEEGET